MAPSRTHPAGSVTVRALLLAGMLAASMALPACSWLVSDEADTSHYPLIDLTPPEAARLHRERENAVRTLEAVVKTTFESPERGRDSAQADLWVRRPDAFRMRAFARFVGGIFDLLIRKDRIWFYNLQEDTLYARRVGPPPEGEGRGASGDGEGEEAKAPDLEALFHTTGLASLILGTSHDQIDYRYIDTGPNGVRLAMINPSGLVEGYVWLEPKAFFKVRQVILGRGGRRELDLRFGVFHEHEESGVWWPDCMEITAPRRHFRLTMRFDVEGMRLNEPLEADVFVMDVPEDVKRIGDGPDK